MDKPRRSTRLEREARLLRGAEAARAADAPAAIAYMHTVLCQCPLPNRDPGDHVRKWEKVNGSAVLTIEAGKVINPHYDTVEEIGLPHGPKARLILALLHTEAIRQHSPVIDLPNLRDFMRWLGLDGNGRDVRSIKEQMSRLSAASMQLSLVENGRNVTIDAKLVTEFDFWDENDVTPAFWPVSVRLSVEYFDSLMTHAVPLAASALAALSHAAAALDVYAWLAQRLCRIPTKTFVPWATLHQQFGGYARVREFRENFEHTLDVARSQYPAAKVVVKRDKTGLILYNSPPPVPPRTTI